MTRYFAPDGRLATYADPKPWRDDEREQAAIKCERCDDGADEEDTTP